jgi:NADPH:quinone reductase-like Zn-dependent oxidoreductase
MVYARKDHLQWGTYAELVRVREEAVAHKPDSLTFTQAAGLPLAGLTALQALAAVDAGRPPRSTPILGKRTWSDDQTTCVSPRSAQGGGGPAHGGAR